MKRLSCWLGRHTWRSHIASGETFVVCAPRGKTEDDPHSDIEMPRHAYTGWRGGNTVDKLDNP